jgi:NADP-dependent 3-hydroxy acid dehydrogenase YdfG
MVAKVCLHLGFVLGARSARRDLTFSISRPSIRKVVKVLGRLDTSVANAGIAEVKPILETTVADRRRMLDINCHGLMNTVGCSFISSLL